MNKYDFICHKIGGTETSIFGPYPHFIIKYESIEKRKDAEIFYIEKTKLSCNDLESVITNIKDSFIYTCSFYDNFEVIEMIDEHSKKEMSVKF